MAELVRDRHVALLVEDPRIELWTAQCAGTQAGPRAGVPVPSSASSMALAATGDQASTSNGIEVRTIRSGFPARQAAYDAAATAILDRGASFAWRSVGSTDWYGHVPPRAVMDWHTAIWTDGSGNLKSAQDVVIAKTPTDALCIIAQVRETSGVGGEYRLECIGRTAASDAWTRVLIEGQATAPAVDWQPAIVVLPSGRTLVYVMRQITSGGTSYNGVRLWYSDDSGQTWSWGGDGIAGRGTTRTIGRMRAAYFGGQVLLLMGNADVIEQYASADGGLTFQYVTASDVADPYIAFDVTAGDDGFVIAYVGGTVAGSAYVRVLGNAFEPFTNATESAALTAGMGADCALVGTDTGELWLYLRNSTSGDLYPWVSFDGGRVWGAIVGDGNELSRTGDTSTYAINYAACYWRGQVVLAHNWSATPGDEDNSVGVMYCGGYSTVTYPRLRSDMSITHTAGWDLHWWPWDLPGDCGWTAAGTAGTEALVTPGRLDLQTTSANVRTYTQAPTSVTNTGGFAVMLDFIAVSGGDPTTNQRGALLRVGDGTDSYAVEVRIGPTSWRLYDQIATTVIGSQQTLTASTRTQIMVFFASGGVATWWRHVTSNGAPRSWTVGPATTSLTAGGASSDTFVWGHRATGVAACATYWYGVFVMDGDAIGQNLETGQTNPTDLVGRLYAPRGRGVYVGDNVSIQARSGPTLAGEAWTISPEHEYPRSAVLMSQPRRVWRSTDLVDTQRLAFKWSTVDTPFDSGLIGIYLGAKNLGRVTIDWYDQGTTSWVNSATYDLHFDLAYTRSGESVVPNGETPAVGYIPRDEWAGASFEVDDTARKVAHHPDGTWSTARKPRLVLHLDAVDDTETASAAGRIVPRQALLILPITATYSGVRITQVAPDTDNPTVYQGYWEVGRVIVGPVHVLADDPSWGRAIEHQDGAEVSEARDRSRRSRVAAPTRRIVELAWADGVDTSGLANESSRSTVQVHDAASAVGGTPEAVAGLMRAIDGGAGQVVYIPRLTGGHAQVLQRRDEAILCRMAGPVRIETVHGDELDNEVVRVTGFTLEEDV